MYVIIHLEEQPQTRGCFLFMPTSAEILGQLQSFQAGRKKPQDVLAEQENRLGVSGVRERQAGLRGAIQNTENLLKQVDPSVTGRTSGSLVTEAQRTKMVTNERAPIADQFSEQSRALEGETANLSDLSGSARTAAQLAISADDQQQNYLKDLYQTTYQLEKDEEDRIRKEREAAEAIRQFNTNAEIERAKLRAGSGGGSYGLGGGSAPAQDDPVAKEKRRAQADVAQMLGSGDRARIQREYEAIRQSAGYGNLYDQMKLQLIEAADPSVKNFGKNTVTLGGAPRLNGIRL